MKLVYCLAVASTLIGLTATPALADWHDIGHVRVDQRMSRDSVRGPRDPARAISLTARRDDVVCDYVRITYRNGARNDVFSGRLERGRVRTIDLPGYMHRIDRIDFHCRSDDRRAGIAVAVNTVEDRGAYGGGPSYGPGPGGGSGYGPGPNRFGADRSHIRTWGVRRPDAWHRWRLITTERFSGRRDTERRNAGRNGHRIQQIALRPVDNNASCSQLSVQFGNGNRRALRIHGRDMERGLFYIADLPGGNRDVRQVWLRCRARDGRDVRIEVWGKRGG